MLTKLGPWLGRTAAADAKFLPALFDRLKTGAGFVGTKVSDLIAWVKANPANATIVATTIASLGYSIADFFSGTDPEIAKFGKGLDRVATAARVKIDALGASHEAAKTGSASVDRQVDDEVAIEVLSWARSFFGSVGQAELGHRMLQAFVEMPLDEVRHGFAIYRLR